MTINNLSHNLVTPSVYSSTINLNFKHAISAESIRLRFENVLGEISAELKKHGCELIGHIKALLDAGPEGAIFFSITDFDKITKSKGQIVGNIEKAKIKLNIIVFEVKNDDIKKIVNCCLEKGGIFPGANRFA